MENHHAISDLALGSDRDVVAAGEAVTDHRVRVDYAPRMDPRPRPDPRGRPATRVTVAEKHVRTDFAVRAQLEERRLRGGVHEESRKCG